MEESVSKAERLLAFTWSRPWDGLAACWSTALLPVLDWYWTGTGLVLVLASTAGVVRTESLKL
jgi:hypothetical protein